MCSGMFTIFKLAGNAVAATRQMLGALVPLTLIVGLGGAVLAGQNGHTFDEIVDRPVLVIEAWEETFGDGN